MVLFVHHFTVQSGSEQYWVGGGRGGRGEAGGERREQETELSCAVLSEGMKVARPTNI